MTLSAGSTPPLGVMVPEVNQFAISIGATLQEVIGGSLGTTVCACAIGLKHMNVAVASESRMFVAVEARRRPDRSTA